MQFIKTLIAGNKAKPAEDIFEKRLNRMRPVQPARVATRRSVRTQVQDQAA